MYRRTLYVVALLAFVLSACGNKKEKNLSSTPDIKIENISVDRLNNVAELERSLQAEPSYVAVSLFNALTEGDRNTVKNNIYFELETELDAFLAYYEMALNSKDFAERTKGYKADYTAVSESIGTDTAYVELVGKTVLGEETRFNVLLVKVEGEWKVDGRYSVLHRSIDDKKQ